MTRVLIVAASPVVRAGLEALLAASGAVTIVGAADGSTELAERVEEVEPEVVLVEMGGGRTSLPALTPDAEARAPAVVVLTDDIEPSWAANAVRAGARAVLPREATARQIVAAVDAAASGLVVLHADAAQALLQRPRDATEPSPDDHAAAPPQPLSPREIEVLSMLAEGAANKHIAARLRISEHTVKTHVASIFEKLDASTRTEAVTIGARRGLVML